MTPGTPSVSDQWDASRDWRIVTWGRTTRGVGSRCGSVRRGGTRPALASVTWGQEARFASDDRADDGGTWRGATHHGIVCTQQEGRRGGRIIRILWYWTSDTLQPLEGCVKHCDFYFLSYTHTHRYAHTSTRTHTHTPNRHTDNKDIHKQIHQRT